MTKSSKRKSRSKNIERAGRKSPKDKGKYAHRSTSVDLALRVLVLSALPLRPGAALAARKKIKTLSDQPELQVPWAGMFQGNGWAWRKRLESYRPGQVNFWKILSPHRKQFPPDAIMVVTSPGPFTASRASVSIANALGFAWNIPVIGVSIEDVRRNSPTLIASRNLRLLKKGYSVPKRALPNYSRQAY